MRVVDFGLTTVEQNALREAERLLARGPAPKRRGQRDRLLAKMRPKVAA
jgi:hypothetical protein